MYYYPNCYINRVADSKSIMNKVMGRHNLDKVTLMILGFCGNNIYKKYGTLVPTISRWEKDITNEMGIMFVKDIDDNYLKLISSLFKNYEFNEFDFPYYKNIGLIDINEIIKKYPNLSMDTIRNITMYSMNTDTRNKLFDILNEKCLDYQEKFCKLIIPISMELLDNNSEVVGKFYDFKYNLSDINFKFDKDYLDKLYNELHEECKDKCKNKSDYQNYMNLYFMCEFEYFFQKLYMLLYSKIDDKNLDMLLNVKEYVINTIPTPTGKIKVIPLYKEEIEAYDVYTAEEREAAVGGETHYKSIMVHYDDKIINTVNFKKKEILMRKKEIMILMSNIISNDLDIHDLENNEILSINSEYIQELINYITKKEVKVKSNEFKRIKI